MIDGLCPSLTALRSSLRWEWLGRRGGRISSARCSQSHEERLLTKQTDGPDALSHLAHPLALLVHRLNICSIVRVPSFLVMNTWPTVLVLEANPWKVWI